MIVQHRQVVISLLLLILVLIVAPGYAEESPPTETPPPEKPSATLNVLQFHELNNRLPIRLLEMQEQLSELPKASDLQNEIEEAEQQLGYLEWEILQSLSGPYLSPRKMSSLETRIITLRSKLERLDNQVVIHLKLLESLHREWLEIEASLQEHELSPVDKGRRLVTSEDIDNLEELVAQAQELIKAQVSPTVQTGRHISGLLARIFSVQNQFLDLAEELQMSGIEQTSPSMFSTKYYRSLYLQLSGPGWDSTLSFIRFQLVFLTENVRLILLSLVLFLTITLAVRSSRSLVAPTSRWHGFAMRPIATGVFLCGMLLLIYDLFTISENLVVDWGFLLLVPLILSIGRFADLLFKESNNRKFFSDISFILALTIFIGLLDFSQIIFFLAVLFISAFYVIFRIFLPRMNAKDTKPQQLSILQWVSLLFVSVVIALGALGYDVLALRIFGYTLSVLIITAAVILIFKALSSLFEVLLGALPVSLLRKNAGAITKHIDPLLIVSFAALWLASVLPMMGLYPTLHSALQAISSAHYTVGSTTLSVGLLFKILIIAYIIWLISRTIKVILLEKTFPKYNVEPGAQHSIIRLINYTIMVIGVLLILNILGVGLGKIAIIGGALSVGIGFGLQAIVNNFVSGLIMLFERPIKIGDVIVVEGESGEVKSLGLRSTTVQTFDNAEIVIPNSELVTKNVTNWTLAEKRVRAKIPVGVAYGSDIEKVLAILLSCAEENPTVLYTPEPRALFLAFGESSLNFELRVWINNFDDRLMVISELNREIELEFAAHGIVIPFPQRDLHVKTVDGDVVSTLATGHE